MTCWIKCFIIYYKLNKSKHILVQFHFHLTVLDFVKIFSSKFTLKIIFEVGNTAKTNISRCHRKFFKPVQKGMQEHKSANKQ